jgi:hypothetical protein
LDVIKILDKILTFPSNVEWLIDPSF